MQTYHHMYHRVDYPLERGYRMESVKLPDWICLSVALEGDSKRLTVHSRLHVNKEVKMNPIYSTDFTDIEIIKDLSGEIYSQFLA